MIHFLAPGPQPNALQATPAGLWILDQSTNQVQFVAYNGAVMKTLETAADRGSGITDSGEALWVASTYGCQILKLDRMTGATLTAYPSPGAGQTGAHGLEWRDGTLWIANPPTATIYQVDVSNGFQVIHTIPAPGNRPHGLAWIGDDLLCVETNHRAIYRLDPQTGAQLARIDLPAPAPEPHGLSVWQGVVWYCDAHTRAVCRLTYSVGLVDEIGRIRGNQCANRKIGYTQHNIGTFKELARYGVLHVALISLTNLVDYKELIS